MGDAQAGLGELPLAGGEMLVQNVMVGNRLYEFHVGEVLVSQHGAFHTLGCCRCPAHPCCSLPARALLVITPCNWGLWHCRGHVSSS